MQVMKESCDTRLSAIVRSVSRIGVVCALAAMVPLMGGCPPTVTTPVGDVGGACNDDGSCTDNGLFCDGAEACSADNICESAGDPCGDNETCNAEGGDAGTGACDCADDTACDDSDACTDDTCDAGTCVFTDNSADCLDQICDPADGACVDCLTDADCADGEACSDTNTCESTGCTTDADCPDDGTFCNGTESCDVATGDCVSSDDACADPATPVCDETGGACVECLADADCDAVAGESCSADNACVVLCDVDADCDDSDLCTDDSCDVATGACVFASNCVDDGAFCNGAETCDPAVGTCDSAGDPCVAQAGTVCNEDTDACDPSTASFTVGADVSSDEGNTGTTDYAFTVTRISGTAAKTLDYAVTGGTGTGDVAADDFDGGAFPSGTVAWAADETGAMTITIKVTGDTNVESDETFTLTVTDPDDAGATIGTATGTIVNDDSSAAPTFTLPTGAGATVGQNSLITGISVADADNGTSTVDITTTDGFLSFNAAPAATAVDETGNAVTTANVLKIGYTLTGTITKINQTLAGFQFTTDRSSANPGTDEVMFTGTDADGGTGSGTLSVAVGKQITLTSGSDTGTSFTGTTGNDVFLDDGPQNFGQDDVLDGAGGHDSIEIKNAGGGGFPAGDGTAFATANIEEMWVNDTSAAVTLDNFGDMPGLNTIVYSPSADALTINDATDGFTLIVDTRNGAFGANVDVDIRNATFGSQSFTLEMQGQSAAGIPLTIAAVISGTDEIETLNINSVSQNGTTATNTITGASSINVQTVNITGDQDLVAGAWTGARTLTINGSAFTGKLTVTSAIDGAAISGGSKGDILTGVANAQSISGNGGADTIAAGAGADALTGGPGADKFRYALAADGAATETIADFSGVTDALTGNSGDGDRIEFATGILTGSVATYSEGLAASLAAGTVLVLTDAAGTQAAAEAAIAGNANIVATNGIFIFLDSANSNLATVVHSTNLATGAGTETVLCVLTGIDTVAELTRLAAADVAAF